MKPWLTYCALVALTGCETKAPEIASCEALLIPQLKAPSSYKLISSTIGLADKNKKRSVFLEYDSVNSYNAPLRETFWCAIDGAGNASPGIDSAAASPDNLDAIADNTSQALAIEKQPASKAASEKSIKTLTATRSFDDEVPVCDRPDSAAKRDLMNEIGVDCLGE